MSDVASDERFPGLSREQLLKQQMEQILIKLKNDPSTITTEDARRLSENHDAGDIRSARIISAVEAFAVANREISKDDLNPGQAPHTSLPTIVQDLHTAVERSPNDITSEILQNTLHIVNIMQKAIGHAEPHHPELELELQEGIAKIEPKIARDTVTKAEADHFHSLDPRAHGRTEKGGITAIAQSVAAKRERHLSLSADSSPASGRSRINTQSVSSLQEPSMWRHNKNEPPRGYEGHVKSNIEPEIAAQSEPDTFHSREMRPRGHNDKGRTAAISPSLVPNKRQESLSDRSNVSPHASEADYECRKEHAHPDRDFNLKLVELAAKTKIDEEPENAPDSNIEYMQARGYRVSGHVDKDSRAFETVGSRHKRENSQPSLEAK